MLTRLYKFLSRLYPKRIKEHYKSLLEYSDIKNKPDIFLGFIFFSSFALSLFLSFIIATSFGLQLHHLYTLLSFIVIFALAESTVYFLILLHIDKKTRLVEKVLPDALQIMASNLRSGLTVDKAILTSARPEFGLLEKELKNVGKEVAVGKDLASAFMEVTKRIKSEKLRKTILLINTGLESGGELNDLLEQTARNLRQQELVEERTRSNILMYIIFIFSAIAFGAPLLFGLSSFLVEVLKTNLSIIEIPERIITPFPISFGELPVSTEFIEVFIIISLIVTSFLGSLVLGLIGKGKAKSGIKFIPILIIISISLFFLVKYIVKSIVGGLFGI